MSAEQDKTATVGITLRVREDLRQSLEKSARERRVSLNQEIIDRLEYVRDRKDLLSEVLQLKYGQREAGILLALGLVMGYAGRLAKPPAGRNLLLMYADWTDQPEPFDNAIHAVTSLLDAARPEGDAPKGHLGEEAPGVWFVDELLSAMGEKPDLVSERFRSVLGEEMETIKKLLGPIAQRMTEAGRRRHEEKSRIKNPTRLAIAVMMAAAALEDLPRKLGGSIISDEGIAGIAATLEQHLKDFLVPDWQQRGSTNEEQVGPEELAAEIKRRA